ncbi:MAG: PTS system fructose-specific EIIABC component [Chlamydiae bacterium]|nr:PTS system fructose-specific EIIABC component [Chlamydiota bacterium]
MTLSELIQAGVVTFLEATSRDDALHQLVEASGDSGEIQDRQQFYDAILKREEIVSTGIGMGVAIPHAKMEGFDHFFLSVGIQKTKEGLEWNALDGAPVRLIFMIGGPADQQTEYLKILSHLTAAIKDEDRRKNILNADSPDQVVTLFEGC